MSRMLRLCPDAQIKRSEGDEDGTLRTITGHASVFDVDYEVPSAAGGYTERVAPGAFS